MRSPRLLFLRLLFLVGSLAFTVRSGSGQTGVSVTTWHNDNWRTGQNTNEATLTTGKVNETRFGLLCKITLLPQIQYNGSAYNQVYAQPLVLWNSANNGATIYVATMNDYVYAYTIPSGWNGQCSSLPMPTTVNLLQNYPNEAPASCSYIGSRQCATLAPVVGVLGTPVIDPNSNTLYVVAESQYTAPGDQTPSHWYHRIHALDATTLAEKFNGPIKLPNQKQIGHAIFSSQVQLQRPGLLLTNAEPVPSYPTLYIAFSIMDQGQPWPSGWVFAYDAYDLSNSSFPLIYPTTPDATGPNSPGGGIWQSGGGVAAGADIHGGNYIYFSTANGDFDLNTGGVDVGDSFVKLSTNLQPASGTYYFTPSDQCYRNGNDKDYGSGGVILVPDGALSSYPYIAIKGEKENFLWVIDRTNPGGFSNGSCPGPQDYCSDTQNPPPVCPPGDWANQIVESVIVNMNNTYQDGSAPAYWNQKLYFALRQDQIREFSLTCAPICATPAATSNVPSLTGQYLGYSATPSVSSNGTSNGIVWAISTTASPAGGQPAILYALRADDLNELYDTTQCKDTHGNPLDQPGIGEKFTVPTIANGYVFIGTQTDFDIYGPLQRTCN